MRRTLSAAALAAALAVGATATLAQQGGGAIELNDPLNGNPLEFKEEPSEAFAKFRQTGENPYAGDQAAVAEGKKIYDKMCASCHLKDAVGRMGPSLVDDQWSHPDPSGNVTATMFEIIHAGGAGAMQAFGNRLSPDEILKVIAHIEALRKQKQG